MLILSALLFLSPSGAYASQKEYQVKAAFLYNFAKFIQWPQETYGDQFKVCIIGDDPFGDVLRPIESKTINGKPIKVLYSSVPSKTCNVIFISRSEQGRVEEILEVANRNILTVGESRGFLDKGGMVEFFEDAGKIKFRISQKAASNAGLKVSAKLLELAVSVD